MRLPSGIPPEWFRDQEGAHVRPVPVLGKSPLCWLDCNFIRSYTAGHAMPKYRTKTESQGLFQTKLAYQNCWYTCTIYMSGFEYTLYSIYILIKKLYKKNFNFNSNLTLPDLVNVWWWLMRDWCVINNYNYDDFHNWSWYDKYIVVTPPLMAICLLSEIKALT